ncbi:MAG: hypothetical protein GVY21_02625 [Gammaproteobacteria bacterium]|jgi:hypothetical protein|nr:hypothetical protein [Gammaproteobacteria bacterium]
MRSQTTGILLLLTLAGCGGGGDAANIGDFSPTPQPPDFRTISGSVSGLEGSVTLRWQGGSQVLTGSSFTIPQAFESGDNVELTLSDEPVSQRCTIDSQSSFANRQDDVTGVAVSCITLNLLRINVENAFTGEPLPGVALTATWSAGGESLSGTSDAEGLLTLEVPTFDGRIVVNADPDDFGEQSKVVLNTTTAGGRVVRMLMQPVNLDTSFDAGSGADLSVGGDVLVSIPPAALVDASGNPYSGDVAAELTVVDPSVDLDLMPGDYLTRDGGGTVAPIQSYGAMSLTLTGAAGEVLDLAPGMTAAVNIPVANAERGNAPATTPLYHYDRLTGYWIEEGSATPTTLGSGLEVLAADVSHFTTWNGDVAFDPVPVDGCVVDAFGASVDNVTVRGDGASYLGFSRDVTDADGLFVLDVRPQSTVLVTVGDGLQSSTVEVNTGAGGASIPDCLVASAGSSTINLTWGENPSDLDTRLYGFSSVDEADDFEVNYTQRSVTVNDITIDLDVDDVTGFGPEVVTFPEFPYPGTYRYAVHLFSGSGTIQNSPARVELNLRGDVQVFTPPQGDATVCWAVLDLEVDSAGNVTVVPLGSWESEDYCVGGDFSRPGGAGAQAAAVNAGFAVSTPPNPLVRAIDNKYYGR